MSRGATSVAGVQVSASGYATGANDNGGVVGYVNSGTFPNAAQAFVWHDGAMTGLPGPAGASTSGGFINDRGGIVGTVVPAMGENNAVIWQDGRLTTLPGLGGTNTMATGLNQKGEVVGYAVNDYGAVLVENSPLDGPFEAYAWSDGKTTRVRSWARTRPRTPRPLWASPGGTGR